MGLQIPFGKDDRGLSEIGLKMPSNEEESSEMGLKMSSRIDVDFMRDSFVGIPVPAAEEELTEES